MPVSIGGSSKFSVKAACALALFAGFAAAPLHQAQAQFRDSDIQAAYNVRYNGMGLGQLKFNAHIRGGVYSMSTDTDLKVPLLGSIFESLSWRGITRTKGTIRHNHPHPKNYYFSFRSSKKRGKVNMEFAHDAVSRVDRIPKKHLSSAYVQVQPHHLKNVMDPMSAVMMISRKGRSHRSVCNNTIPVYDGLQRFNLRLSYKRSVRVRRSQSGGYAGPVIVCKVRYEPVSGYKPHKKDLVFMARNKGIELWLMPLPRSRNYAPYRFVIPLPIGTAEADLDHFNIRHKNGRRIALVR